MTTLLEDRLRMAPRVSAKESAIILPAHRELLARLDAFEAPYLEEKLMKEKIFGDKPQYQEAFVEFKKYAALTKIFDEPLAMASKEVDAVWHQFILFTRQYHGFCKEFLGNYMHHSPSTSLTPVIEGSRENLREKYKQVFGKPSPLWKFNHNCTSCCTDSCASCGNDGNDG